ncbi:MAG: ATP-binding protein [Actinoallomurus sp.]
MPDTTTPPPPARAPGAAAATVGQFRLVRLQVINWGTFHGYKDLPVDRRGLMFTGASGSGKSSLMDAHSVGSLPFHDWRFNASSDVKGGRAGTRTLQDYVRGAYEENDDDRGQHGTRYLRAGGTTWSAIGVTYDDGEGRSVTGIVVRWFPGGENDAGSLKEAYLVVDGSQSLQPLFRWAEAAEPYKVSDLAAAVGAAPKPLTSQKAYVQELYKRMGLACSSAALTLLGKAKALKNVGDFDAFVRTDMLDTPGTFAAADKLVEQFVPLHDAYQVARRAWEQEQVLKDVPEQWAAYVEYGTEVDRVERLRGPVCEAYLRAVRILALDGEIYAHGVELDRLSAVQKVAERESGLAQDAYLDLVEQVKAEGSDLERLVQQAVAAEGEAKTREVAYKRYQQQCAILERTCPADLAEFEALHSALPTILAQAKDGKGDLGDGLYEAFSASAQADQALRARNAELQALQGARSLIPPDPLRIRREIAAGARVQVTDLPYAAELIDIASGQERWRPAAEKVLRAFAMRLLVPEKYKDVVRGWIDGNNLRGVIDYSIVTGVSAHQPHLSPDTLAGKLTVDLQHPCGSWLAAQISRQFRHHCVEDARDLDDHDVAVTVNGTVKYPGGRYRKDDRAEVSKASSYILGSNPAAKIDALTLEVQHLAGQAEQARKTATSFQEKAEAFQRQIDAAEDLAEHYRSWTDLDHWEAAGRAAQLRERIQATRDGNLTLKKLIADCDEAKKQWEKLSRNLSGIENDITRADTASSGLSARREREQSKPHTVTDDSDRAYLDTILEELDMQVTSASFTQFGSAFTTKLDSRRTSADGRRGMARTKLEGAIGTFIERWRDAAPDDSGDVDACGASYAELHQRIHERALPEAMGQFQRLLVNEAIPSISILYRAIEKTSKDIEARIDVVNSVLKKVEFSDGTHLKIDWSRQHFDEAREFKDLVDRLLKQSAGARKDPGTHLRQFPTVNKIMARFTSTSSEDHLWRTRVLDIRESYTFYARELHFGGDTARTYRNTSSQSGGEQEKLVAFCLAAALSYHLAESGSGGRPRFAAIMLDEAFCKSDERFATRGLAAFDGFGFQLMVAAPARMAGVLEPFIGQLMLVDKRPTPSGPHSHAQAGTFGELLASAPEGDDRASA